MKDGIYWFSYVDDRQPTSTDLIVRFCRFPFGTSQCRKTLARLRRDDPPDSDCGVPDVPISTITVEDRAIAYHFLARATFLMLRTTAAQAAKAAPYLMAFSTLANVQYACVEMHVSFTGVSILPTKLTETEAHELLHSTGHTVH